MSHQQRFLPRPDPHMFLSQLATILRQSAASFIQSSSRLPPVRLRACLLVVVEDGYTRPRRQENHVDVFSGGSIHVLTEIAPIKPRTETGASHSRASINLPRDAQESS
jgi:hypothetical protein